MNIVFASCNPKKTAEIQRMAPDEINIICLKDIPGAANIPQAEETGSTFLENAYIKADYWSKKLNMPVLAEDSGILIDALNGYPGVHTKRCIDELCPGTNINADRPSELYPVLLKLMEESGKSTKSAHWVSSMVFINSTKTISAQEEITGTMCTCAGEREFGFDQYFKPNGVDKTLSELSPEEKDNIGPRKKVFQKILSQI